MKLKLLFCLLCFLALELNAQNVGIGTSTPGFTLDILDPDVALLRLASLSDHTIIQLRTVANRGNYLRFNRDGNPSYWIYNSINDDIQFRPLAGSTTTIFKADGKVGIGTTNPIEQLHTAGNIRADGRNYYFGTTQKFYGDAGSAIFMHSNSSTVSQLIFRDKEDQEYGRIVGSNDGDYFSIREANAKPFLQSYLDSYVRILVSNSEKLRVLNSGRVGIGTSAPAAQLQVRSDATTELLYLDNPTDHAVMRLNTTAGKGNYLRFYRDGLSSFWLYNSQANDLQFRPSGSTAVMVIKDSGNVGIGTTNPGNKLEVNGLIRAKEVRITLSNWPDYVFEDSYQLPTLKEEAQFIKSNGHLSGFLAEGEMEGALTVGDVTKRQQEKLEQVLLHLIEMNEKVEKMETEMTQMQKQIEHLTKENSKLKNK